MADDEIVARAREAARFHLGVNREHLRPADLSWRRDLHDSVLAVGFEHLEEFLELSIDAAKAGDKGAHDAIIARWRERIYARKKVPDAVQIYVADFLGSALGLQSAGVRKKRGPSELKNDLRNKLIAVAIEATKEAGLAPTRNAASKRLSGCAVVSEVLGEIGVHIAETGVETIWKAYRTS